MFHTWPNSLTVSEVFSQILATCNNCRTFRRVSVISWSGWCQCKALQQCETRSFLGRSLEKRLGLIGGPELEHLELFAELLCFPGALSFLGEKLEAEQMLLRWASGCKYSLPDALDSVVVSCCKCARHFAPTEWCTTLTSCAEWLWCCYVLLVSVSCILCPRCRLWEETSSEPLRSCKKWGRAQDLKDIEISLVTFTCFLRYLHLDTLFS